MSHEKPSMGMERVGILTQQSQPDGGNEGLLYQLAGAKSLAKSRYVFAKDQESPEASPTLQSAPTNLSLISQLITLKSSNTGSIRKYSREEMVAFYGVSKRISNGTPKFERDLLIPEGQ